MDTHSACRTISPAVSARQTPSTPRRPAPAPRVTPPDWGRSEFNREAATAYVYVPGVASPPAAPPRSGHHAPMAATPVYSQAATPRAAVEEVSLPPGKKRIHAKSIGHYMLGRTIGEGTFGKVKLGTHVLTGEKVAVKVLEKQRIVDSADVERVAREVHILKLIRHRNVIRLFEIIETSRQLFLIMEYAAGGELFDYIVNCGRVSEIEACEFFRQIIDGVEEIHRKQVVHRDLKPENLLLDEQKRIKIVDFGLSNTYAEGKLLKTACGSPCYAAPEMIAGKEYIPSLCDVWSCGVILFAMVCGCLPFEDANTNNLYRKILGAEYTLPSHISEPARLIINGMLTTDPVMRLTTSDLRAEEWFNLTADNHDRSRQDESDAHVVEEDVLQELLQFDFPLDYARRCLAQNKHNHVTTTYHLLRQKKRRLLDQVQQMQAQEQPAGLDGALPTSLGGSGFEAFDAIEDVFQASARTGSPQMPEFTPSAPSRSPRVAHSAQGVASREAHAKEQSRWASPGPALSPRTGNAAASALVEEPKLSDDDQPVPSRPDERQTQQFASPGRTNQAGRSPKVEAWQPSPRGTGDENVRRMVAEAEKAVRAVETVVCGTGMVGGTGSGASSTTASTTARGHPGSTGGTASTGATPGYASSGRQRPSPGSESPRAVIADVESRVRAEMATGVNGARRQISAGRSPTPSTPRVAQTPRAVTPRSALVSARGYVANQRRGSPSGSPYQPPSRVAGSQVHADERRRYGESPSAHHREVEPQRQSSGGFVQGSTGGDTPHRDRPQVSPRAPLSARAGTPQSREARSDQPHSAREARGDRRATYDILRTSGRRPNLIMQELHRVFAAQRIAYKQVTDMSVKCQWLSLRFEVEVAALDRRSSIHAVRARHVIGEPWQYKAVLSRILAEIRIA